MLDTFRDHRPASTGLDPLTATTRFGPLGKNDHKGVAAVVAASNQPEPLHEQDKSHQAHENRPCHSLPGDQDYPRWLGPAASHTFQATGPRSFDCENRRPPQTQGDLKAVASCQCSGPASCRASRRRTLTSSSTIPLECGCLLPLSGLFISPLRGKRRVGWKSKETSNAVGSFHPA